MTPLTTGVALGGRYRLVERIASGGMGTVWAAEDETLHRRVAVKVLNEGLSADERFTERFRREARSAAGLSHSNIAGVFDFGEEDGRPYIVMELVDGETLADRVQRLGRLDPADTVRIGAAVADALAHAHAAGTVHRDVKPANIMLDGADHVRVMDFGIAAPLEGATGLTATGAVMGTSRYISPEQAEGERATSASDVYSLGVVLYETLAGEAPFVRETPVATAMAHIHERPRSVRDRRPEIPLELADTVHSALAKDPSLRPTPEALAAELRGIGPAAATTEPIQVGGDTQALTGPEPAIGAAVVEEVAAGRTMPLRLRVPPGSMGPGRPRRDRRIRWLVGAGVVAALLIVGAIVTSGANTIKAPRLLGLERHAARVKAERLGVHPVFRVRPADADRGIVVKQRPFPGRKVPKGITMFVVISSGPALEQPTTVVPAPPPGHDKHGKGHGHKEKP